MITIKEVGTGGGGGGEVWLKKKKITDQIFGSLVIDRYLG